MKLTAGQADKVRAKKIDLKLTVISIRAKLDAKKNFHRAAWQEYGSELCACEMIDNEKKDA